MKFIALKLPGAWLIEPEVHIDARGVFRRHFCVRELAARGIDVTVAQGDFCENSQRGTSRGFHYQASPAAEAKTLSCFAGALHDIIVDLRSNLPIFMKWIAVDFSARGRRSLHVLGGCANAWLTVARNTIVHYYISEFYVPTADRGLRYSDPTAGFRWPAAPMLISEKDRSYCDFDPRSFQA